MSSEQGSISQFFILSQRECGLHKDNPLAFLCTDPTDQESSAFKCQECLTEKDINSKYLMLLSQIEKSNDNTVFLNWPIPGDKQITGQIKGLSDLPKRAKDLEENVKLFLKKLRCEVFDKIDRIEEQMKEEVSNFADSHGKILQQYNISSAKQELKAVVLDQSADTIALSQKIRKTVSAVLANEEQNKSALRNRIEKLQFQQNAINFEGLNMIKDNIFKELDSLTLFCGENNFAKNQEFISKSQELSQEQLNNLTILCAKMRELSQKYGPSYDQQKVLKKEQQENSYGVCQLLRKQKELSNKKIDELEQLLVKYPVFDLASDQLKIDIKQLSIFDGNKSIPFPLKWKTTSLEDSEKLLLSYSNDEASILQRESLTGQAITQYILQKDLVYSFKCQFNKPLNSCCCIRIGLIEYDKTNSNMIGQTNDLCFESNTNKNKVVVRGEFLNSYSLRKTLTTVHFKICIQTQTFLFSDETHENVNQVVDLINPEGIYRVGILFWTPGNDYRCTFFHARASENLETANQF